MASIIWCDHVKHVVEESRTEVAAMIDVVVSDATDERPPGFAYFTIRESQHGVGGQQRALNVSLISSFEAFPGDAI